MASCSHKNSNRPRIRGCADDHRVATEDTTLTSDRTCTI